MAKAIGGEMLAEILGMEALGFPESLAASAVILPFYFIGKKVHENK